jgi:transcriptional regulator with XRE-family HTH domain
MARRIEDSTAVTAVGAWRVKRRVTQRGLALVTGIPLRTYKRLETGEISNPPVRYLINIAAALDVELPQLFEPGWSWTTFNTRANEPPDIAQLFGSADKSPTTDSSSESRS